MIVYDIRDSTINGLRMDDKIDYEESTTEIDRYWSILSLLFLLNINSHHFKYLIIDSVIIRELTTGLLDLNKTINIIHES